MGPGDPNFAVPATHNDMARVPGRRIIVWSFAHYDQHHVEVAMKYVLLGNLSPEWASKQSERPGKAKAKLDKLGIKIELSTTRRATTISSTSWMPRMRRRCSRSPSGTRPRAWDGSRVCRPSTPRPSKRIKDARAKRRVAATLGYTFERAFSNAFERVLGRPQSDIGM